MQPNKFNYHFVWLLSLLVAVALIAAQCGGAAAPAQQEAAPAPAEQEAAPVEEAAAEKEAQPTEAAEAAASSSEGEKIALRIAWWGSQDRHDRTIKVIEMYEAENPNVDITFEFAGWDDYWTKMTTQAAGGNLPDVMQQDYARLEEWVSRDLIMPLDDYVKSGVIDLSDVPAASIDGGRIDGTLYAINIGSNSQTIILDADAV